VAVSASSYDQVPYQSLAVPQTHPDRLAVLARVFGLTTAPIDRCRVLELGCAGGGNLIPMAFNLPASRFVGIDLSRLQVEEGQQTIRALGIDNVRIEHASIADIDESWGSFDYIICHGVYSWVDRPVQDRILQVAAANLAADGVAFVSYNTYPGWHAREMVRHMMQYHAGQFAEPAQQVEQARALLAFLVTASRNTGPHGELLAHEATRLEKAADSYIFHEHLEKANHPVYFHTFIERADEAGLQFLAEADVAEMVTSALPPEIARTLEQISRDLLHLEQYMDFVKNRQFRQTLLCHRARRPNRKLTPAILRGLFASSRAVADAATVDLAPGVPVAFKIGSRRADVSSPVTKAALQILSEEWPATIAIDTLCQRAIDRAAPFLGEATRDQADEATRRDLFGCLMHGLLDVHTHPVPCTNVVSETPRAHPLARLMAEQGPIVITAHHQPIQLDDRDGAVLVAANGERSAAAIADLLAHERADVDESLSQLVRWGLMVR
jgi:cyclopropane fatty-acyl-phospholipid synthase-like methyltransferase